MSDEIDLTVGEPDADETPAQRRRRERREARGDSDSGRSRRSRSSSGTTDRDNASLATQLGTAFNKLADQVDAREDEELAEALREESHALSQGFVSLTSTVPFLRPFLLLAVALLEYGLAFWRVGRILIGRFLAWRERRIIAAQEAGATQEWEESTQPGIPVT